MYGDTNVNVIYFGLEGLVKYVQLRRTALHFWVKRKKKKKTLDAFKGISYKMYLNMMNQ